MSRPSTSSVRSGVRRGAALAGVAAVALGGAAASVATSSAAQARPIDPTIRTSLDRPTPAAPGARRMAPKVGVAPAAVPSAGLTIPSSCSTLTTVVKSDQTLWYGISVGNSAELVTGGVKLPFAPKAITYVVSSTNRGITLRRFVANDATGKLYNVIVTERMAADGSVSYSVRTYTMAQTGWGTIRTMTSSYPYVYALTSGGAFLRYTLSGSIPYAIGSRKVLAASRWTSVATLSRAALWNMGKDARGVTQYAEDVVALTKDGGVRSYVVPRTYTGGIQGFTLKPSGWASAYSHLSVGGCSTTTGRPMALIKPSGEVSLFFDRNGDDQSGADFRWATTPANNLWTGMLSD